jgi:hypothetical protein
VNRYVLVVLASLFIVAGARAQSVGFAGNIPFDFVVGNTTLRAGQYTITPFTMNGSHSSCRGQTQRKQFSLLLVCVPRETIAMKPSLCFMYMGTIISCGRFGDRVMTSAVNYRKVGARWK